MTVCKKDDASEEYVFIASKGVYLSLDVCHSRKSLKMFITEYILVARFIISYILRIILHRK